MKTPTEQKPAWFARADEIHLERVRSRGKEAYDFNDIIYVTMGLAGEAGEVANEVKKAMRGDFPYQPDFLRKVREEIADTRIYLELLAHALDVWSKEETDWDAVVSEKLERFARRAKP